MKFFIDTANLAQIKEAHESGIGDSGCDGMLLIEQIAHVVTTQGYKMKILAASICSPNHMVRAAELCAHVCTCPPDSIVGPLRHPLTGLSLAKFLGNAKKMQRMEKTMSE